MMVSLCVFCGSRRSIDVVRNQIKAFASTVSLSETNKPKVVIVDEADYMNADSVQPALRNFIETFYLNCFDNHRS